MVDHEAAVAGRPFLTDAASWSEAASVFRRPQPVTIPMVALFAIIPFYLYIGAVVGGGRATEWPATTLDAMFPLWPSWSLVYASLFLAALLPAFVVHQQELLRRTLLAYLTAWLVAYAVFLAFPSSAPTHPKLVVRDFDDWVLATLYDSDVPYNCFPSLHVAQCFLAAFAAHRVHRGVGRVGFGWASLVAISTLFTKQHYVADVIAGVLLAFATQRIFLRGFPREAIPALDRRVAPKLALAAFGVYGLMLAGYWALYTFAR